MFASKRSTEHLNGASFISQDRENSPPFGESAFISILPVGNNIFDAAHARAKGGRNTRFFEFIGDYFHFLTILHIIMRF